MTTKPGQPVRGSNSGRPIMALLDTLGQRWVLRILWELSHQAATFRELQSRCDSLSPTILNKRLQTLRGLDLVLKSENGYALSEHGISLAKLLLPLHNWADQWAAQLDK